MRLELALRNPKVFVLAVVIGAAGVMLHKKRTSKPPGEGVESSEQGHQSAEPPWAFVRYAFATILIAMIMPVTTRVSALLGYFAYGLLPGAIAGATDSMQQSGKERAIATAKGMALGVVANLLLRVWTYS